jgi:hypothetical protein
MLSMIPWKLVGYGVAVLAIGALIWRVNVWHNGYVAYKQIKPAYDGLVENQRKSNEKVEKVAPIDEAARVQLAEDRAALEAERAKVSRAWQRVRAVQETPDETGHVVVRLSDAWGVCFAAAAAGNAADVAACEAGGGNGAITAEPS